MLQFQQERYFQFFDLDVYLGMRNVKALSSVATEFEKRKKRCRSLGLFSSKGGYALAGSASRIVRPDIRYTSAVHYLLVLYRNECSKFTQT